MDAAATKPQQLAAVTVETPLEEKADIVHQENATAEDQKDTGDQWGDVAADAERGEQFEKQLGVWESLKMYKRAVFFSFAASTCIIMEGYDTALLGSFWALPSFQERYGQYYPSLQEYQVPARWQSGISEASSAGAIFGIFWGAFLVQRLGYRWSLILNLALMIPFIGIVAFSPNRTVLLVGELLCGLPWGTFSTLPIAYASEICPISLRAYLTTYINLCWIIGQFISAGIIYGYSSVTVTQWSYRLPWCIQWVWPVPLIVAIFFAPESPWWLVRSGKLEQAEKAVRQLAAVHESDQAHKTVAMMVRTNQLEKEVTEGASYLDCFRGTNRRRTEISMLAFGCQVTCGLYFATNSTYFFEIAGLSDRDAFKMSLGTESIAGELRQVYSLSHCPPPLGSSVPVVGTFGAWFLIRKFGRRTLYLWGLSGMTLMMLLIGILACFTKAHPEVLWAQAAFMYIWVAYYTVTVGPLAFAVVGETSSTRLRNKTVGLSRNCYNVLALVAVLVTPYMINPSAWGWAGYTGFFWTPICLASWAWAYYRLPEMKDRSWRELDILFERGVPARKFASTVIDPHADH
ncbi:hypothetical protein EHS25_008964 [Saitozyma podzolica]|uniref:Major facilitator superfamily (MFS) profile domain-containing protein n=1 Tax=Saitozyma podzolica TaxID=1890683 RepID=A0A427YKH7_9TREE|nr:hypothetical protein EHS25_008964 [Saitozyma podzolica]